MERSALMIEQARPLLWLVAFLLSAAAFAAVVPPASAADVSGRYQGVVSGKKPDGTGPEQKVYLILRQEGDRLFCTAGLDSFDQQIPAEDASVVGDEVRFTLPWGGGAIFDLKASGNDLNGTVRPKPGVPPAPFDKVALKRIGDLTLSDRIPRLTWEGDERSPRLLQLRKDIADAKTGALTAFWKTIEPSGAPLIEHIPDSDASFLVTFVWKGTPETRSVLLLWPRLALAHPDDYFLSHVEGSDLWFKTLRVRRGTRMYYRFSPNDPLEQRPEGTWPRKPQADPLNPKHGDEGDSLLELPGALPQPWYAKRPGIPRYTSAEVKIKSKHLASERKVLVYTPPGFSKRHAPYPSIYLTDGEDPDGLVFATWTFENLLADGKIPPVVVIRIVNPDQETRNRELSCNEPFFDYVNDELVPFIRTAYNTSPDPSKRPSGVTAWADSRRRTPVFGTPGRSGWS
jgi:hypothetical protein